MTIRDILKKACKLYEIKESDVSYDSFRQKVTELSQQYPKNPVTGETLIGNSFFDRAKRGERNTLIFDDRDGQELILLLESYFKKIMGTAGFTENASLYSKVAAAKEEVLEKGSLQEYNLHSEELYRKQQEEELETYLNQGLNNEIPYIPPITDEDYALFLSDYHYELVRDSYEDPYLVTGIRRRSYNRAHSRLNEIKREWWESTIAGLFCDRYRDEDLLEDLFRVDDNAPEHHTPEFFTTAENLKDIDLYLHLKETPLFTYMLDKKGFETFLDKIADRVLTRLAEKTNAIEILKDAGKKSE